MKNEKDNEVKAKTIKPEMPRITGVYRTRSIQVPDEIYQASGIVINGRRIKSVIFTTDIAIIRNCNADAVLAVYPFTPQQVISHTIITAASMPVFCGIGGGLTGGLRSAVIAKDAEAQGAFGVVVNAPFSTETIRAINEVIDIPIISTVVKEETDFEAIINAGVSIFNISAADRTAELVRKVRSMYPSFPIIATGGPSSETILETIRAGANVISYTPPTTAEFFKEIMTKYRNE